jgi:hypothetical protein
MGYIKVRCERLRKLKNVGVIMLVCIIILGVCLDMGRADEQVRSYTYGETSHNFIVTGSSITAEDVCTVEFIETSRSNILNRQLSGSSDSSRKNDYETFSGYLADMQERLLSFRFLVSSNICIHIVCTDITEGIHFIHDKDGKKNPVLG